MNIAVARMLAGVFVVLCASTALCCAQDPAVTPVKRCKLGANGPDVSCIAYGTLHMWEMGAPCAPQTAPGKCPTQNAAGLAMIEHAMSLGITTFDLASNYRQQPQLFGGALQLKPELRDKIQIIAKMDCGSQAGAWGNFGFDSGSAYDTSIPALTKSLDTYLTSLNTTYVDVLMFHRQDYIMDADKLAAFFKQLKADGKVRYFSVSNYDRAGFELLHSRVEGGLVANEIELSALTPQAIHDGRVSFHYQTRTAVLAWSALGGDGWGKSNRLFSVGSLDGSPHNARIHAGLDDVARNMTNASSGPGWGGHDIVALAWLLRHPAPIVPIIGTTKQSRMTQQVRAVNVAERMTVAQWYHIADAVGIPLP